MAMTELNREMHEAGAVTTPQPSLRVTVSAETSASPEQVLAAARDFSEHRAQIWPNVEAKRIEVHDCGNDWADVTEGTLFVGVFRERCRYDWSQAGGVTATVIESNVLKPGSSWCLRARPRDAGGSDVEMTIVRDYRIGPKGTIGRSINHIGGQRLFGWMLRSALAAIERTPAHDSTTNPRRPAP